MLISNSEFLRTEIMDVLRAFGAEEENFTHYFSCAGGKFYNSIEYNGVFYDFEEEYGEAEFRQRLEEFLAHPQRREALCRAARETGEEYSAQRFAQRVETIYLEQIERSSLRRIPA